MEKTTHKDPRHGWELNKHCKIICDLAADDLPIAGLPYYTVHQNSMANLYNIMKRDDSINLSNLQGNGDVVMSGCNDKNIDNTNSTKYESFFLNPPFKQILNWTLAIEEALKKLNQENQSKYLWLILPSGNEYTTENNFFIFNKLQPIHNLRKYTEKIICFNNVHFSKVTKENDNFTIKKCPEAFPNPIFGLLLHSLNNYTQPTSTSIDLSELHTLEHHLPNMPVLQNIIGSNPSQFFTMKKKKSYLIETGPNCNINTPNDLINILSLQLDKIDIFPDFSSSKFTKRFHIFISNDVEKTMVDEIKKLFQSGKQIYYLQLDDSDNLYLVRKKKGNLTHCLDDIISLTRAIESGGLYNYSILPNSYYSYILKINHSFKSYNLIKALDQSGFTITDKFLNYLKTQNISRPISTEQKPTNFETNVIKFSTNNSCTLSEITSLVIESKLEILQTNYKSIESTTNQYILVKASSELYEEFLKIKQFRLSSGEITISGVSNFIKIIANSNAPVPIIQFIPPTIPLPLSNLHNPPISQPNYSQNQTNENQDIDIETNSVYPPLNENDKPDNVPPDENWTVVRSGKNKKKSDKKKKTPKVPDIHFKRPPDGGSTV